MDYGFSLKYFYFVVKNLGMFSPLYHLTSGPKACLPKHARELLEQEAINNKYRLVY